MKKIIYLLPFICFLQLNAQSYSLEQGKSDFQKNWNALTQPVLDDIQKYFDIAIDYFYKLNRLL